MPVAEATDTADAMMRADLRGLDQHGVSGKLPQCLRRIRHGGTRADVRPRAIREATASVAIDGRDSWGRSAPRQRYGPPSTRRCATASVWRRCVGGHRGYALAVMFEILTGVLAGGARQGSAIGHPFDYGTS
jgi:LDH2 family malate/lactate/ureidoglycolate dehydrogenase